MLLKSIQVNFKGGGLELGPYRPFTYTVVEIGCVTVCATGKVKNVKVFTVRTVKIDR